MMPTCFKGIFKENGAKLNVPLIYASGGNEVFAATDVLKGRKVTSSRQTLQLFIAVTQRHLYKTFL